MKKNTLFTLMVLVFSGCAAFNKQKAQAEKFYRTYPNELARVCADAFPVAEKLIPSKPVVTHDTVIVAGPQLNCPPDSNGKTKVLNCPPVKNITNTVFKTDTLIKENTARADVYKQNLLTCGTTNENQIKQIEKLKTTCIHRLWWIIGIAIALVISIGSRFISFKLLN